MAEWTETNRGVVFPWQCDHYGHLNVRYYTHFFDDAGFQIWSLIGLTLEEIHDCGNLYSPCFEELGELLETECRSHWGGLNPDGDRLSDVEWNEIAEEWYESCLECFEDSVEVC